MKKKTVNKWDNNDSRSDVAATAVVVAVAADDVEGDGDYYGDHTYSYDNGPFLTNQKKMHKTPTVFQDRSLGLFSTWVMSPWWFRSVRQTVCTSVCLYFGLTVRQSVCTSVCLYVGMSVRLSVCTSGCLFVSLSVRRSAAFHLGWSFKDGKVWQEPLVRLRWYHSANGRGIQENMGIQQMIGTLPTSSLDRTLQLRVTVLVPQVQFIFVRGWGGRGWYLVVVGRYIFIIKTTSSAVIVGCVQASQYLKSC